MKTYFLTSTTIKIKQLLESTWCEKPEDRINANGIMATLKSLIETEADYLHVKKYDIISAIADPVNKLISNRYYLGTLYRNCFVGSTVLAFLKNTNVIKNKEEGISILNIILKDDHLIEHVTKEHDYKDEYLFYVFVDPKKSTI